INDYVREMIDGKRLDPSTKRLIQGPTRGIATLIEARKNLDAAIKALKKKKAEEIDKPNVAAADQLKAKREYLDLLDAAIMAYVELQNLLVTPQKDDFSTGGVIGRGIAATSRANTKDTADFDYAKDDEALQDLQKLLFTELTGKQVGAAPVSLRPVFQNRGAYNVVPVQAESVEEIFGELYLELGEKYKQDILNAELAAKRLAVIRVKLEDTGKLTQEEEDSRQIRILIELLALTDAEQNDAAIQNYLRAIAGSSGRSGNAVTLGYERYDGERDLVTERAAAFQWALDRLDKQAEAEYAAYKEYLAGSVGDYFDEQFDPGVDEISDYTASQEPLRIAHPAAECADRITGFVDAVDAKAYKSNYPSEEEITADPYAELIKELGDRLKIEQPIGKPVESYSTRNYSDREKQLIEIATAGDDYLQGNTNDHSSIKWQPDGTAFRLGDKEDGSKDIAVSGFGGSTFSKTQTHVFGSGLFALKELSLGFNIDNTTTNEEDKDRIKPGETVRRFEMGLFVDYQLGEKVFSDSWLESLALHSQFSFYESLKRDAEKVSFPGTSGGTVLQYDVSNNPIQDGSLTFTRDELIKYLDDLDWPNMTPAEIAAEKNRIIAWAEKHGVTLPWGVEAYDPPRPRITTNLTTPPNSYQDIVDDLWSKYKTAHSGDGVPNDATWNTIRSFVLGAYNNGEYANVHRIVAPNTTPVFNGFTFGTPTTTKIGANDAALSEQAQKDAIRNDVIQRLTAALSLKGIAWTSLTSAERNTEIEKYHAAAGVVSGVYPFTTVTTYPELNFALNNSNTNLNNGEKILSGDLTCSFDNPDASNYEITYTLVETSNDAEIHPSVTNPQPGSFSIAYNMIANGTYTLSVVVTRKAGSTVPDIYSGGTIYTVQINKQLDAMGVSDEVSVTAISGPSKPQIKQDLIDYYIPVLSTVEADVDAVYTAELDDKKIIKEVQMYAKPAITNNPDVPSREETVPFYSHEMSTLSSLSVSWARAFPLGDYAKFRVNAELGVGVLSYKNWFTGQDDSILDQIYKIRGVNEDTLWGAYLFYNAKGTLENLWNSGLNVGFGVFNGLPSSAETAFVDSLGLDTVSLDVSLRRKIGPLGVFGEVTGIFHDLGNKNADPNFAANFHGEATLSVNKRLDIFTSQNLLLGNIIGDNSLTTSYQGILGSRLSFGTDKKTKWYLAPSFVLEIPTGVPVRLGFGFGAGASW
ncbi:hypothetical protein NO1_1823, partial [Candidatus Termititenax aidoneus]